MSKYMHIYGKRNQATTLLNKLQLPKKKSKA